MRRLSRDPAALIPLKQSTYQVLLALADGESLHGYAIMQAVSEMTSGRETILPGTLYAALARMVDDGLVEERETSADPSGGPARRYYRRTSFGRVERQVTLLDPGAFNAPITIRADMTLAPDTDLLEYVCNENPRDRDRAHLVGRTADERAVVVPPELLARYVGVYELERPAGFGIRTIEITSEGNQLWVALNGRGRLPMTPLSERMFSPRLIGTYEFVMDAQGTVTHLLTHSAEEVVRANKRR